jgi:hypothetical protein
MNIGQVMADALPNGIAVSPMVYPSHYPAGTLGFSNPADHPYEIIAESLRRANELYAVRDRVCQALAAGAATAEPAAKGAVPVDGFDGGNLPCGVPLATQRPWIQAFDIGATYTAEMIREQIKAVRDQGGTGYLLWNARNVYRDIK